MVNKNIKVFYDGSCPLCTREISFYKKADKAGAINWVDVANCVTPEIIPGFSRETALRKFHVQSAEGVLISGGPAFAILWSNLPRFFLIGKIFSIWPLKYFLVLLYELSLVIRPILQRLAKIIFPPNSTNDTSYPKWLLRELRSNQAGEVGATRFYEGILSVSKDPKVRQFAAAHLVTEKKHLKKMNKIVATRDRTVFLPIWVGLGYLTGIISATLGSNAVYIATAQIEKFVELHYRSQILRLSETKLFPQLRNTLEQFHTDELMHLKQAENATIYPQGLLVRCWCFAIRLGSFLAVVVARRL